MKRNCLNCGYLGDDKRCYLSSAEMYEGIKEETQKCSEWTENLSEVLFVDRLEFLRTRNLEKIKAEVFG